MSNNKPAPNEIFLDISKMLSKSIHDINNPFCVILGQLSIVEILLSKEEINKDKIFHSINKMKSGADKMQDRINGLREFYKVAMGDTEHANWQALEKALKYINLALDENSVECDFPEGDLKVDLQDIFIVNYYLMKLHLAPDSTLKLSAQQEDGQIIITAQGDRAQIENIDQSMFDSSMSRLNANSEDFTDKIVIKIPI